MARFGKAGSKPRGSRKPTQRRSPPRRFRYGLQQISRDFGIVAAAAFIGFGLAYSWQPQSERAGLPQTDSHLVAYAPARDFPICGSGQRVNCVVDGDTFWFDGERVRIADIDAPEISRPECSREAELGRRSTQRLQALLNEGPFELRRQGSRDRDVYGRLLRTVHRDGGSLGDVLVNEGLARHWRGRSERWCG
ncbi:thermonuclease family protein [Chelativorans sp. ZYF759]|uniref:thermonuclease family protein n=1 Tax=Chelativorans sp. ZYF759 TaxID=2692213 RepID=UPI00145E71EB|nr:thermonuclease family protein [Chelativorans sp. ZYF759]NMG39971.1 thermonuclease family protein [Chelativorans sp. ZYF759]